MATPGGAQTMPPLNKGAHDHTTRGGISNATPTTQPNAINNTYGTTIDID